MSGPAFPKPERPNPRVCPQCNRTKRKGQWCPFCRWTPPAKPRKPIARGAPPERGGPIRKVSAKRRAQLSLYGQVRLIVLARDGGCVVGKIEPDKCERYVFAMVRYDSWPVSVAARMECEHVNGRRGWRLTDVDGCVALHRACHQWVTDHAKEWKPRLRAYLAALKGGGDGGREGGAGGLAGRADADPAGVAAGVRGAGVGPAALGSGAAGDSAEATETAEGRPPCPD